jgi:uncharacterized protein YecE (DUF72 family)
VSGAIRIGTSGWHYPHWLRAFYPADLPVRRWLGYYAERFDTVELNNTFYRLPKESAVEAWRDGTPPGFLFAVKGSRFLTHMKKLTDPEPGLARFFRPVEQLGAKLGPILFQFPPGWGCDPARLEAFLAALPSRRRYAFELRDPSWHTAAIYRLLERYGAALCLFELAGFVSPIEVTADLVYVRLHGPGGRYQGSYGSASLRTWARRIRGWARARRSVHVYFDNDQAGYAAANALALREMV